jgi:hypothetical protein
LLYCLGCLNITFAVWQVFGLVPGASRLRNAEFSAATELIEAPA